MAIKYEDTPMVLKHATVAIFRTGKLPGSDRDRFVSAWNIARARLTEYGYLAAGSESGPLATIRLTQKGAKRSAEHRQEGRAKALLFDTLSHFLAEAESAGGALGRPSPESDQRDDRAEQDVLNREQRNARSMQGFRVAKRADPTKKGATPSRERLKVTKPVRKRPARVKRAKSAVRRPKR